jgi:hypothetical protein
MGRPKRPTSENFAQWLRMREERMFLGHHKGALDAPEMTTHLGPTEQARSWALRASACRQQRMADEVLDAWTVAFSLAPDDPWLLSHFAVWQLYQGKFAEGLKTASLALDGASPDHKPFARCIRAQALWFCGQSQESLSDFVTAAHEAPLNSPTQLCAIVSTAVVLANSRDITPKTARLVLDLATHLRSTLKTGKLPRLRALLRWATGLAEAAAGRRSAGARDLLRARGSFLNLGDVATAAAVTLDYAALTGRPQEPLFLEILDEAPADTQPEILIRLDAIAAGRSGPSEQQELRSLVMTSNVHQRWS